MAASAVEIALMLNPDRSLLPAVYAQLAQAYQASGVVDYVHVPDQMMGWWPPHLWNRANSPLAGVVPDLDSSAEACLRASSATRFPSRQSGQDRRVRTGHPPLRRPSFRPHRTRLSVPSHVARVQHIDLRCDDVSFLPNIVFRGIASLPVRFCA